MKKWVENKEPSGAVVHTLVFGHHGDDPKVPVCIEHIRYCKPISL